LAATDAAGVQPASKEMAEAVHGPIPSAILRTSNPASMPRPLNAPSEPVGAGAVSLSGSSTATPADNRPVQIVPAKVLKQVLPEYPKEARTSGLEGKVVLAVRVGNDGKVIWVSLASGDPLLARAATAAVMLWRYQPARQNGRPVESDARVILDFKLHFDQTSEPE